MSNQTFKIITPFYNVEQYIGKTVASAAAQDYDNYQCILINDKSTDSSMEICRSMVGTNDKFILVDNDVKKSSLENIYDAIMNYTSDDDVVVILDGDDFLFGSSVLTHLNEVYSTEDCWLTYGSYLNLSSRTRGKFARQIPQSIILNNQYRDFEWCTSHLRTFKASLFKKIDPRDLKDKNEKFFTITGDLVIMFPMLEMAAHRSRYIEKLLYIWNDTNTLNDHKKDHAEQLRVEREIRNRKKYEPIN